MKSYPDVINPATKPKYSTKSGPVYETSKIAQHIRNMVKLNAEPFLKIRAKKIGHSMNKSTEQIEKYNEKLDLALATMLDKEKKLQQSAKQVSSNIRQSTERLSQGLDRLTKQANFEQLERYVTLLERANTALSSLAEIEKTGHLAKITKALN